MKKEPIVVKIDKYKPGIRVPTPPPSQQFKSKKTYTRKVKHKKGIGP